MEILKYLCKITKKRKKNRRNEFYLTNRLFFKIVENHKSAIEYNKTDNVVYAIMINVFGVVFCFPDG